MKEVLRLIRDRVGKEPGVDHPSLNLEQYFIQVVEKAHRSASEHSGASPAEHVAGYLSHEEP